MTPLGWLGHKTSTQTNLAKHMVGLKRINKDVTLASILSFYGSNLVEKGAQKCKSSDVTEDPSATKSLKCLASNENVQYEAGGNSQSQRQSKKVSHKMAFLYNLPSTIQCI